MNGSQLQLVAFMTEVYFSINNIIYIKNNLLIFLALAFCLHIATEKVNHYKKKKNKKKNE
jgi:hypothetical protein